jgi:hypothetical protein
VRTVAPGATFCSCRPPIIAAVDASLVRADDGVSMAAIINAVRQSAGWIK